MKRFAAILLSLVITFTLYGTAFAAVEDTGFSDVAADAWYAEAAAYVRDKGIMSYTSGTYFEPETAMTRAMLAAVLWRQAGSPVVNYLMSFSDVENGAWYTEAVRWAVSEQLITGYGNGVFGTNDPVTREQTAAILWRYAGSPEAVSSGAFADEATISTFASRAVDWVQSAGIMSGVGGNQFNPKASATRAQMAVILYQYLSGISNVPPEQTPVPEPLEAESKTLIAYFTWSNNTEGMAQTIQELTGGDLYEIIPLNAYPDDYSQCGEVALAERDNDTRPAIGNLPESIEEYDRILIGYPIWWHTAPMIIGTFLESYDLAGVDIYPFAQSASMDTEQFDASMEFIRANAVGAIVHDGLFTRPSNIAAITAYLENAGLLK